MPALYPYEGNNIIVSDWLSGFIWGRGAKTTSYSIQITVSSRPLPIIRRLTDVLVLEEFQIEERAEAGVSNQLIMVISHPELKLWKIPPVSKRRLGQKISEEFLQGFLDSRLNFHPNGLSISGSNWINDVKTVFESHGCECRVYGSSIVVPKRHTSNELLAGFMSSLQQEGDALSDIMSDEVQHATDVEIIREKLAPWKDTFSNDWLAGYMLTRNLTHFDPVRIQLHDGASEKVESAILKEAELRGLWHKTDIDGISISLESQMVDWLKTVDRESVELGPRAVAGAVAAYAVTWRKERVILCGINTKSESRFLSRISRQSHLEFVRAAGGELTIRKTIPGSKSEVLDTLRTILSTNEEGVDTDVDKNGARKLAEKTENAAKETVTHPWAHESVEDILPEVERNLLKYLVSHGTVPARDLSRVFGKQYNETIVDLRRRGYPVFRLFDNGILHWYAMTRQTKCWRCGSEYSSAKIGSRTETHLCESCREALSTTSRTPSEEPLQEPGYAHHDDAAHPITQTDAPVAAQIGRGDTVENNATREESKGEGGAPPHDVGLQDIVMKELLQEIRRTPQLESDLAKRHGPCTSRMIKSLRKRKYPIRYWPLRLPEGLQILCYYDASSEGDCHCYVCGMKSEPAGPFCSTRCEERFKTGLHAKLDSHESEHAQETSNKTLDSTHSSARPPQPVGASEKQGPGRARLQDIIPSKCIWHLSKKARVKGKLLRKERNILLEAGRMRYFGRNLSKEDANQLEEVLSKVMENDLVAGACHNRNCKLCKTLREVLNEHGILYK